MVDHKKYIQVCIKLAETALANGDPPVGSIIVFKDRILAQGIESGKSTNDITNHAEILAVRDAINKGHKHLLDKSIMYSTHEPCIMCSYLIRHHKIPHIVFSLPVDHVGGYTSPFQVLQSETVPKWGKAPKITSGICEEECSTLNQKFQEKLNQK